MMVQKKKLYEAHNSMNLLQLISTWLVKNTLEDVQDAKRYF